jgi:hypothetical protein
MQFILLQNCNFIFILLLKFEIRRPKYIKSDTCFVILLSDIIYTLLILLLPIPIDVVPVVTFSILYLFAVICDLRAIICNSSSLLKDVNGPRMSF